MSTRRSEWIDAQVAPTRKALEAGDGCHHEEGRALAHYLAGETTPDDAARAITAPVLGEQNPPACLYRLIALLCEAQVDLSDDRDKVVRLLAAIHSLPTTGKIDWKKLPDFCNMWSDLYRLHFHGPGPWEREEMPLPVARADDLREYHEAIGAAEATMYLHGVGGVPAGWGYQTLNLVCSGRPGVEVFVGAMHAWLTVAGARLKPDMSSSKVADFHHAQGLAIAEYWRIWKKRFLQLSEKGSPLSASARQVSLSCYNLM